MAYFPKEQSNPITNMVAELNHILNGQYFNVTCETINKEVIYNLNLTQKGLDEKKYLYIPTNEGFGLNYTKMIYYLQGILIGLRTGLELSVELIKK